MTAPQKKLEDSKTQNTKKLSSVINKTIGTAGKIKETSQYQITYDYFCINDIYAKEIIKL